MAGQGAFGRTALELLKEVAYCEPGHLPRHNDTAIKEVLLQIHSHWEVIQFLYEKTAEATGQPGDEGNLNRFAEQLCAIIVHDEAIARNKRLLLLYLKERTDLLQQIRWTRGRQLPEDVAENLSASEVQYFRNYDKCLVACNKAVGLDLTTDVEPPTAGISSMVSVIVRNGTGAYITTGHGDVFLMPNIVHWIPKEDAEQLVRDGLASRMSDNDIFEMGADG